MKVENYFCDFHDAPIAAGAPVHVRVIDGYEYHACQECQDSISAQLKGKGNKLPEPAPVPPPGLGQTYVLPGMPLPQPWLGGINGAATTELVPGLSTVTGPGVGTITSGGLPYSTVLIPAATTTLPSSSGPSIALPLLVYSPPETNTTILRLTAPPK